MKNRWYERINPTAWVFVVGILLLWTGLAVPAFVSLAFIGGFIILLYLVVLAVWFYMGTH